MKQQLLEDSSSSNDDESDIEEEVKIIQKKNNIDYKKFVQRISLEELQEPLIVGDQSTLDEIVQHEYVGGFFFIETDKKVYYPGETISISVHLRT